MRKACCAVGTGGDYKIATGPMERGSEWPWHIMWLPKGYGPTPEDFVVCLIAEPPGEDWSVYGLGKGKRPPLVEAICAAIEAHMEAAPDMPQERSKPA